MHYPTSQHPFFKVNPYNFAPTRDKVSICFGEPVKASQSGKYQVNSNGVAHLLKDKAKLLQLLEKDNIPVPKPIHRLSEFLEGSTINLVAFDDVMTFPVQARRYDHTVLIEDYRDLLEFVTKRKGDDYCLHGMSYQEYSRMSVTLSPRLGGQIVRLRSGTTVKEGIIHMEGVIDDVKTQVIAISRQVTKLIKFDVGTVELIYTSGELMVENVHISPTLEMLPAIDHIIRAMTQR